MKLINRVILSKKTGEDFISVTTVRRKMEALLTKKQDVYPPIPLKYLALDGRKDLTLMPKNQMAKEEHLTFISEDGYITHEATNDKKGPTIAKKIFNVLEENDSVDSCNILMSDGENSNSGWKGTLVVL